MIVRDATTADTDAIALSEADNLGPDAWSYGLVEEGVAGRLPSVRYLVAELDGRVVGHAVASVVADIAELQRIAVAEEARGRGVARALLAAVVDHAAALGLYAASGFVEVDRRRRYYPDGATAVVLRRALTRGCGASG